MTPPNTMGVMQAHMRDGSVISYRDADPSHVRQQRFELILQSDPLSFSVTEQDGSSFTVDLLSGELIAGNEHYLMATPGEVIAQTPMEITTPLRLIYYKHMEMSSGSETGRPEMMYYVVGWQTTQGDGSNLKLGIKVFPSEHRYEVTVDI